MGEMNEIVFLVFLFAREFEKKNKNLFKKKNLLREIKL